MIKIMFILKVIKSHFTGPYDKQNLTPVVISYGIYFGLVSFHFVAIVGRAYSQVYGQNLVKSKCMNSLN